MCGGHSITLSYKKDICCCLLFGILKADFNHKTLKFYPEAPLIHTSHQRWKIL